MHAILLIDYLCLFSTVCLLQHNLNQIFTLCTLQQICLPNYNSFIIVFFSLKVILFRYGFNLLPKPFKIAPREKVSVNPTLPPKKKTPTCKCNTHTKSNTHANPKTHLNFTMEVLQDTRGTHKLFLSGVYTNRR